MATVIQIASTAFNAGQPLVNFAGNKQAVRVVLGQSDTNSNINGATLGVNYIAPSSMKLNRETSRAALTVTIYPVTIEDTQVNRWPQHFKNAMADLITKGYIEVTRGGVPQTAANVIAY